MDIELMKEPLGQDSAGKPVYLKDVWAREEEVNEVIGRCIHSTMFHKIYGEVFQGDERWNSLDVSQGDLSAWSPKSTYVKHPPYFVDLVAQPVPMTDTLSARELALLRDSITTDHISPAGSITFRSPPGH